jgi:LemA protein
MKKWIPWIILGVIVIVGFLSYNSMVEKRNETEKSWANVESSYQRRADLIPNLVSTVKGYAAHEKETLEGVIKARAAATQTTINSENITPDKMAAFQKAQQGLSGALSRLLVTVEKYPDLKANQNFLELQSQLEGTENRINVQRDRYNATATVYKNLIQKLPNVLYASILGFKPMPLFEAAVGSDVAPKVEF